MNKKPNIATITEPTRLTSNRHVLYIAPDYCIDIDGGEYLTIVAGQDARKSASKFEHSNVSAKVKTIHDFKRTFPNGGKRWYSRAGVDFYFVIPKSEVIILPEKGYSYVKAIINGVNITLNVSGGGCASWVDYVFQKAHISIGHSIKDMKKLAEVSVKQEVTFKDLDDSQIRIWNKLVGESVWKKEFVKNFKAGKPCKIALRSGFSLPYSNETIGNVEDISFTYRTTWRKATTEEKSRGVDKVGKTGPSNQINKVYVRQNGLVWVKPSQIDWEKTIEINS